MYFHYWSFFHQEFPAVFKFYRENTPSYIFYISHNQNSGSSVILWYIFYAITKRIKILFLQQFYLTFSISVFSLGSACSYAVIWLPYCSNQKLVLNCNLTKQLLPVSCANGIACKFFQEKKFKKQHVCRNKKLSIVYYYSVSNYTNKQIIHIQRFIKFLYRMMYWRSN